jgi:carboxypeptidase family protein/TonB-dependent receptor-like protein
MLRRISSVFGLLLALFLSTAITARAQVQTGSITGIVTDTSNAVLPGVTVSLSGEKLIGGAQTQTTDPTGSYRFDRLPPGTYALKVELQGFRSVQREGIQVSAAFVAPVNVKLEVGSVQETVTVTGASPTVDTKSNLQQTVMNQDVLEGIPSGRDPWSVAKIIPGVQVATYDVGGTQSIQQSSLSSHGSSTNDVSYNIDGATVNWPGGGGGATMLYYDQGMFEEVNYMTSAIPAEVMVGGVSINMVTKDAGNKWRGNTKYSYSSGCLTSTATTPGCFESDNIASGVSDGVLPNGFLGNPTKRAYDFNFGGGGALVQDRVWVTGMLRRWVIDKLTNAKNLDGSQALDDNTLKNYSGKAVFSTTANQKFSFSFNWNNKIRGHRRDTPPDIQTDIASLVQTNPASSTQAKYTGIRKHLVFESSFSLMKGETDYSYQPGTPPTAVRAVYDGTRADFAAARQEEQPNSRAQFDNTVSYTKSGWGGDHLFKGGVQFGRLYFDDQYDVLNSMYLIYTAGKATSVTEYNTPTEAINISRVLGVFAQDSWSIGSRLTLNLGIRVDHNTGILPAQATTGGTFVGPQSIAESQPISQNIAVWRTGVAYDPKGDGQTALKASASRYGLQVGIDRVTNVNPLSAATRSCPWTDPNGDGIAQPSEIQTSGCTAFPGLAIHYASPNGPSWPYSDEITAGVERQVMKDMRVGVMYYYRTNRNQIATSNTLVPPSSYTTATINVPNGPNGSTTATLYNLASSSYLTLTNQVLDNQPFLDTKYNGVEFTANKRLSQRWQMVAGLTIGKNTGGLNTSGGSGQATTITGSTNAGDLNDPNQTRFASGIVGNDSPVAFRLSGSYQAPWDLQVAGSLVSNSGYPYVSTYTVTRAAFGTLCTANCGGGLVRSSQVVILADRGDERLPATTLADLRVSRSFRLGTGRRIVPRLDFFNITNRYTPQSLTTTAQSATYLVPTSIVPPRIIRIGLDLDF